MERRALERGKNHQKFFFSIMSAWPTFLAAADASTVYVAGESIPDAPLTCVVAREVFVCELFSETVFCAFVGFAARRSFVELPSQSPRLDEHDHFEDEDEDIEPATCRWPAQEHLAPVAFAPLLDVAARACPPPCH